MKVLPLLGSDAGTSAAVEELGASVVSEDSVVCAELDEVLEASDIEVETDELIPSRELDDAGAGTELLTEASTSLLFVEEGGPGLVGVGATAGKGGSCRMESALCSALTVVRHNREKATPANSR